MKSNKLITVGFDTVDPKVVLNGMSEYDIKLVHYEYGNPDGEVSSEFLDHLIFEGTCKNMEEFYNIFYTTGESLQEYFEILNSEYLEELKDNCGQ